MLNYFSWQFGKHQPPAQGRASSFVRNPHSQAAPPLLSWILPQTLAVGRLPCVEDAETLLEAKIQTVVSLCANAEGSLPKEIRYYLDCQRFVLPDSRYASVLQPEQLIPAVDAIHQSLTQQRPVFVHCLAGIERSPLVCVAYLCRHQGYGLWESLNWVKQVHPAAMPTESQIQAVRSLVGQ